MRSIALLTLALLIFPALAEAQSKLVSPPQAEHSPAPLQPPASGVGGLGNSQKSQVDSSKQPAGTDQRGTDQMPLSVKILPSPKSQAGIEEEQRRADEHTANERGLTAATWTLAGFTLLLAFIASGQVALFIWQLRLIRDSLDDAKIAAEAARDGAAASRDHADIARTSTGKEPMSTQKRLNGLFKEQKPLTA